MGKQKAPLIETPVLSRYSFLQARKIAGCSIRTISRRIAEGWLTRIVERVPGKRRGTNFVTQTELHLLIRQDWDGLRAFHREHFPSVHRAYTLTNGKK